MTLRIEQDYYYIAIIIDILLILCCYFSTNLAPNVLHSQSCNVDFQLLGLHSSKIHLSVRTFIPKMERLLMGISSRTCAECIKQSILYPPSRSPP